MTDTLAMQPAVRTSILAQLLAVFRKPDPSDPRAALARQALRLAETSPHLLADVGFRRTHEAAGEVWSDGSLQIVVTPGRVSYHLL